MQESPSKTHPLGRLSRRQALACSASLLLGACRPKCALPLTDQIPRQPNVIVFLSDALRADHLDCYGAARGLTPNITAFSQNSLLFERHYAAASWTKPAVASLFTGVLPALHQMVDAHWSKEYTPAQGLRILHEKLTPLATLFEGAGYQTAWFLSNPHLVRELGFARGFQHYRYVGGEATPVQLDAVLDWIKTRAKAPFFLFIHAMDPHDPYISNTSEFKALYGLTHEEALRKLPARDARLLADFHLLKWNQRKKQHARLPFTLLSPAGISYVKQLYDTEVHRMDEQFGRLLAALKAHNHYDDAIVVMTADHGHAFNEHGFSYHGHSLYENEVHIPLLIRLPHLGAGLRIPWSLSQCDLYPTLAKLIGQPIPAHIQGHPLIDARGRLHIQDHRDVFCYLDRARTDSTTWDTALINGPWKVMTDHHGAARHAYHLDSDPLEKQDLLAQGQPDNAQVDALRWRLQQARKQHQALAEGYTPTARHRPPAENTESLEALGYL